jgi:hypothetical protein
LVSLLVRSQIIFSIHCSKANMFIEEDEEEEEENKIYMIASIHALYYMSVKEKYMIERVEMR